jgi:DNA ligase-1
MLFADLVATSAAVAATPKRAEKIARLAELLRRLEPSEIAVAVAFLSGELPMGRIGVGWSTLVRARVAGSAPAAELTIGDVVRFLDEMLATVGQGSAAERSRRIAALFARATAPEADFLTRLLAGELRQGALAGVMSDAVAASARVSPAVLRRAAMLTGDLARAAEIAFAEGEAGLAALSLEIGRPVQPMLASTSADPAAALAAHGRSVRRMEDRRRARPGAPLGRERSHLHAQPERRHRPPARAGRDRYLARRRVCGPGRRGARAGRGGGAARVPGHDARLLRQ